MLTPGERGDLLPAQAGRAAPARVAQADVGRGAAPPAGPAGTPPRSMWSVTPPVCRDGRRISLAPAVPGSTRPSWPRRRRPHDRRHADHHRPPPRPRPLGPRPRPLVRGLRRPPPRRRQGAGPLHRLRRPTSSSARPWPTRRSTAVDPARVGRHRQRRPRRPLPGRRHARRGLRPTLTFRSTAISGAGEDWALDGEVTIGEVTKPIRLAVELGGVRTSPTAPATPASRPPASSSAADFGIAPGVPAAMLGDVIKIQLDLELIEPRLTQRDLHLSATPIPHLSPYPLPLPRAHRHNEHTHCIQLLTPPPFPPH